MSPANKLRDVSVNRRTLVGGAAVAGAAIHAPGLAHHAAAQDEAVRIDPGTPGPAAVESLHEYPLVSEPRTFRIMITDESPERFDNEMTEWFEQLTGITIEWLVVPAAGAIEQMTLTLAGGDMPDAFMGFLWTPITPTQLAVYGEQGLFVNLEPLLADNTPNLNHLAADEPDVWRLITAPSGAIYSLPQINQCYHCSMDQKMWINTVWLENLGLEIPTTPDEFRDMLQAFKDGDPNGNGEADEIGITVTATTSLGDLDGFLMNPFQFSPKSPWLYLTDGVVTSSYTQDGWREGVKYMRSLYADGLLDPDSFTQSNDEMLVKARHPDTARIGAVPSFWKATHFDFNSPYFKEYAAIPQLVGPSGLQQTRHTYGIGGVGGLMITSSCDDPELLLRWADGLYATEATLRVARGTPGLNWRWANEGEVGINEEPAIWAIIEQPPGSLDELRPTAWWELCPMWFSMDLRHGQAVVVARDDETETILYDATYQMQEPWAVPREMVLPPLFFTSDQASTIALTGTGVLDLVRSQYTTWVTGQGDPDAEWDMFLDQLNSIGYEEYLATWQAAYDQSGF